MWQKNNLIKVPPCLKQFELVIIAIKLKLTGGFIMQHSIAMHSNNSQHHLTRSRWNDITPFSEVPSVGNRILDSEHEKLQGIIGEIARLVIERDVAALPAAFEILEDSLCTYFVIEENIAQTHSFDFAQHKLVHEQLSNMFKGIKNGLLSKNGKWTRLEMKCYVDALWYCLARHIDVDSKPLRMALNSCFQDLDPEQGSVAAFS